MKKRILSLALTLALCMGLAIPAFAEGDLTPATSFNKNRHTTYRVETNLYQDGEYLVRAEFDTNNRDQMIVEYYNSEFELVSAKTVPFDNIGGYSGWGGFFAGEQYNFIISGKRNASEDDANEVIRVAKYDKNWNNLGYASLLGANTTAPFQSGNLRCAEYNGMLYIHTCHEMYQSSDGKNHQANMTFSIRESDMTITDGRYGISNSAYGYVSHSLDQYIMIDQEHNIITLDQGDTHPRAAVLHRYDQKAGNDTFTGTCQAVNIQEYPAGTILGAPGGVAETSDSYVTVYRYRGPNEDGPSMYIAFTPKDNFTQEATKAVRLAAANPSGTTLPTVAPTGLDGGYVLWADISGDKLYYVSYTADGRVSEVKTAQGALPDFQPIVYNGKLVWYVTNYSIPTFYELDASGITTTTATIHRNSTLSFVDVAKDAWYYEPVRWAVDQKITSGTSNTTFSPEQECNTAQILTFLWRANGSPEPAGANPFSNVSASDYYYKAALWAKEKGLVSGSSFHADTPCTRAAVVTYLWKLAGQPTPGLYAIFLDIPDDLKDAAAWAAAKGITSGTGLARFSPDQTCTRGQIATFLYNAYGK